MRICLSDMYLIIQFKHTDNIIGLKEEIAMRLEGVVGVEVVEIRKEEPTNGKCKVLGNR